MQSARTLPTSTAVWRRRGGHPRYGAALGCLALLSAAAVTQAVPAQAQLAARGPVSAEHGFPTWFQDGNGVRLELCLDQNGMCLLENPLPGEPISFPDNFGAEAFWFAADSTLEGPNGEEFSLVLATEAAFADEEPVQGDQVAFGRIRVRASGLVPGESYTVTHPYGTNTFVAQDADRNINVTDDHGCFDTPCSAGFDRVLNSKVGPFLKWPSGAPTGYLGDPDVAHVVTGSPSGNNLFRVVGGGLNLTTDLFNVSGKLSTAPRHEVTASDPAAINVATAGSPLVLSGTTTGATSVAATLGGTTVEAVLGAADASGAQPWTATFTAEQVAAMPSGRLTASAVSTLADGTTATAGTLLITKDISAPAKPTADPAGGESPGPVSVHLFAENQASIRYTTDGTQPGPASTLYDGLGIPVNRTTTIRARAYDDAGNEGDVFAATYTIATPPPPPAPRPATPTGVDATSGARGGPATAIADWDGPAAATAAVTSYRVRAQRFATATSSRVLSTSAVRTVRPDRRSAGLTLKNTRGWWRLQVRAVNGSGASAWSTRSNAVKSR